MKRLIALLVLASFSFAMLPAAEPGASSIVVIVNPGSGVDKLSRQEVVDIFLGRYRKLPSGRAALPIDGAESSDERVRFYQLLVKKSPAEMSSYWARLVFSGQTSPPFAVQDSKTALELVQSNPNAIAYVDRSLVSDKAIAEKIRVVLEIRP